MQECIQRLDDFESACGQIKESRITEITVMEAIGTAETSHLTLVESPFKPLFALFDRQETLKKTVEYMTLDSQVRYQQAVYHLYHGNNIRLSGKQLSISLFSRHLVVLEIIIVTNAGKETGEKMEGEWKYKLLFPLIPLDEVFLIDSQDTAKSNNHHARNTIKLKLSKLGKLVMFQCAGVEEKQEFSCNFLQIQREACPTLPKCMIIFTEHL